MKTTNWNTLKSFAQARNLSMQYLEDNETYEIIIADGWLTFSTTIDKRTVNSERTDFETNFKANANKPIISRDSSGREISTPSPFSDASGFRFRGTAVKDSVASGTTKDIDFKLTAERYINGGRLMVDNVGLDDTITFQVVDKDNILGMGAGVVLDEFITGYYIPTNVPLEVKLDYPARIIAGLYIRLKYTSTHTSGCTVKCNLYLHWKAS